MAANYTFDYSASTADISLRPEALFGESFGTILANQFWNSGSLEYVMSWTERDFDGVQRTYTVPVNSEVGGFQYIGLDNFYTDFGPFYAFENPNLIASDGFIGNASLDPAFTVSSVNPDGASGFGWYMSFADLPSIFLQPPSLPTGVFDGLANLQNGAFAFQQGIDQAFLSSREALGDHRLSDIGPITVEAWNDSTISNGGDAEFKLTFSAALGTALTLGDLLGADIENAGVYDANISDTTQLFDVTDHVELVLGDFNDNFSATRFEAESLTVQGGAGIDVISVLADASFARQDIGRTNFVELFGDAGDDDLTVSGVNFASIDGGVGNDLIFVGDLLQEETPALVMGGDGNDTILGPTSTPSVIDGGDGDDIISGGAHDDVLRGGAGNDDIISGAIPDGAFSVPVAGSIGDEVFGGDGDDRLVAGRLSDVLHGESGNDRLTPFRGDDELRGGSGKDTYVFDLVGVSNATVIDADGGILTFLFGVPNANSSTPEFSRDGSDVVLEFGAQHSITVQSFYDNPFDWHLARVTASGDSFGFLPFDLSGAWALDDINTVYGSTGTAGDDIFLVNRLSNAFMGGDGHDTLSYINQPAGIIANMATGIVQGVNETAIDTLSSIEAVVGTPFDDALYGSVFEAVSLSGAMGDDRIDTYFAIGDKIDGGSGTNTLIGFGGSTDIRGGGDTDYILAAYGDSTIDAGDGNDQVYVQYGTNTIDMGEGFNLLLSLDLFDPAASDAVAWSADTVTGGASDDYIYAGRGEDTLSGGAGNDWLAGGGWNDTLTGGDGFDRFIFGDEAGFDVITDFTDGEDYLDFTTSSLVNDFNDLFVTQLGTDLAVSWNGGASGTTLLGIDMSVFDVGDSLF